MKRKSQEPCETNKRKKNGRGCGVLPEHVAKVWKQELEVRELTTKQVSRGKARSRLRLNTFMTHWALQQNDGFTYSEARVEALQCVDLFELKEINFEKWFGKWICKWFENFGKMTHRLN